VRNLTSISSVCDPLLHEVKCAWCDAVIVGARPKRLYCSIRCSRRAQGAKKRKNYFLLFERDFFRCVYCGKSSIEHGVSLALDHVIPRSKGGKDVAGNLTVSCHECNSHKCARILRPSVIRRLLWLIEQRNEQLGIGCDTPIEMQGGS